MTSIPAALNPEIAQPQPRRSYSTAWWGMVVLIMTEAMIFGVLLASYFYLRAASQEWPLDGISVPELGWVIPFSFVLWGSSVPVFWAEKAIARGRVDLFKTAMTMSLVLGAAFLAYTIWDFAGLDFGWRDNAYGSIWYTIIGLHSIHVVIGLVMNVVVQTKAWLGRYDHGGHVSVNVFALYWHFVDAVWVFVFLSLFLSPRVL